MQTIRLLLPVVLLVLASRETDAVNAEWNTGNGDWNVPGNWLPNDVPDGGLQDVLIGNRPAASGAAVTLIPEDGTSDSVFSLTISGAADLLTNGNQLHVVTQTILDGIGSTVQVAAHSAPGTVSLNTLNLDLNNGAVMIMNGGLLAVGALFEINDGTLTGWGQVNVGDGDGTAERALDNSDWIQVQGNDTAPRTLTLQANGLDTLDLDGDTDTGVLSVTNANANVNSDTLTLVIDGPLTDTFEGELNIGQRDTLTFNDDFSMVLATVNMNGGNNVATLNGPADITSIGNSAFTITGAAVITNDMTFIASLNSITLNPGSSLTLAGTVAIPDGGAFTFSGSPQLIITGNTSINDPTGDFDWDGTGGVTTRVAGNGLVTIQVDQVDLGNDTFNGTIALADEGDLAVVVAGSSWTMAGTLQKDNAGTSSLSGDDIIVTGSVNVDSGILTSTAAMSLANGSNFTVDAGANASLATTTLATGSNLSIFGTLELGPGSVLAGPANFQGGGLLRLTSSSTVAVSTTVNTASFDWDGTTSGHLHSIIDGVVFTINASDWGLDDPSRSMDDNINLGGSNAQIAVNGVSDWRMSRTLTTNTSGLGTAYIGGTARMILNSNLGVLQVDGPTVVNAPITFGPASLSDVDGILTLDGDAVYDGGGIQGSGNFNPSSVLNTVTDDSGIVVNQFNFDRGDWMIEQDATLSINVGDVDSDNGTNHFDNRSLTLNGGGIFVTTGEAEFVMNGSLGMHGAVASTFWGGEPLDIGNDAGSLNAHLEVTGPQPASINAEVDFNSDADVHIAAGGELRLQNTVSFDTVNAGNQAEFTGPGVLRLSGIVNVNEAVTLHMVGGTVDMDGTDLVGDFINIDAPMTVNVATLQAFGRPNPGGGVNTLDIDNNTGSGVLTVNLDAPGAEWTINPLANVNLVNDAIPATLLAGSPINVNGQLNVTGDVRIDARLDIGAPTVTLNTPNEPLRLSGGTLADPNTIAGAAVNGPGLLAADDLIGLVGYGGINADVNFHVGAMLRANDGMLTINGALLSAGTIGTADNDGILNVVNPWNTNVATAVSLQGGELRGGLITNGGANGVSGRGLLSARVINNSRITQSGVGSTLVLQTVGNDNDWDGAGNTGILEASGAGGTLELRDNAIEQFHGTVNANAATVYTNGFGFDFEPGSAVNLTNGTFTSVGTTRIGGALNIAPAADSTISLTLGSLLDFEAGSSTTLNGNLWLMTNNGVIRAGATFAGVGSLRIPINGQVAPADNANIDVLVDNHGRLSVGGGLSIGRNDTRDYQQSSSGALAFEFAGPNANQADRLFVSGAVQLAGNLESAIIGGYVPTLGQSFTIISAAGGVSGTFDSILKPNGIAADQKFEVDYSAMSVQVTVVADTYWPWVNSFPALVARGLPALQKGADPDGDGVANIGEFALDGNPESGASSGKMVAKIAPVASVNRFTLTFPVRNGAVPAAADPAGGPIVLEQAIDDISYTIEASTSMSTWTLDVTEVTGADALAIQAGLPPANGGWSYRTFMSPSPAAGNSAEFMRVVIANTE